MKIMATGRINEEESSLIPKLDIRDQKILSILSRNSRTPLSIIAKKTNLNRDTVKYKIQRLENLGIIKKFYAEVNQGLFGYSTCHVFMLVDEKNKDKRDLLIEELGKHPNTKSVMEYTDTWDIEWVLLTKNLAELEDITNSVLTKHSNILLERDMMVVIKYYSTLNLPYKFYDIAGYKLHDVKKHPGQLTKIDDKDFHILKLLTQDSRITAVEIGKKIHLSADAIINRIKKLLDSDVITKFTILTDRGKIGYHWYTFVIQIKYMDESTQSKLKEYIKNHSYIIRCVRTSGTWDFILYISADTPKNFHTTVKEIRKEFSNIIKSSEMWFAYKEHFFTNFPSIITMLDFNKK